MGLTTNEQISEWMRVKAGVPARRMGRSRRDRLDDRVPLLRSAGYVTGNWIEVDGGHHRSAF